MKICKYAVLIFLVLASAGYLFRGWLFRHAFTYTSNGPRRDYTAADKRLVEYIDTHSAGRTDLGAAEIIRLGLELTSRRLYFSASPRGNDPNMLIHARAAHCVGYAAFFTTICNYLFHTCKLSDRWIAKSHAGQLHLLGINLHRYANDPFFASHDFVTIENKRTGQVLAVDPTAYDYLSIDFITYDGRAAGPGGETPRATGSVNKFFKR